MFREFWTRLSVWEGIDTWIAMTGAMAAMACALPGAWLLLRRQSMLGDALSHAAYCRESSSPIWLSHGWKIRATCPVRRPLALSPQPMSPNPAALPRGCRLSSAGK